MLVSDDSKLIKLLAFSEEEEDMKSVMTVMDSFETDGVVEDVAVWNGHSKIVVSSDQTISILELSNKWLFSLLHTYR